MPLLKFTSKGIFCPRADVYIDPWKPVQKALITHGHSDHARPGHRYYLCTKAAGPAIRYRLGNINLKTVAFGRGTIVNGVRFTFHPAGHLPGSAQVRVEYKGEVWVVSGDYKTENDGFSEAFEPVKCHTFITESTFGLPVYRWKPQDEVFEEIHQWWRHNREEGKVTVLAAYSLGKAQRLIHGLDGSIGRIYTHGAVEDTNEVLRKQGLSLKPTILVTDEQKKKDYEGAIVIAPPAATGAPWMRRFGSVSIGMASGWMALRGTRRRRSVDRGFALSDHADWIGLLDTIKATGAEKIFVTHGYTDIFSRHLRDIGYDARVVKTGYEGEEDTE